MSECKQVDTQSNPVCDPNNTEAGHDTLIPGEEPLDEAEYANDCAYDNFLEACVRYSMADNEPDQLKAAWRAFYYLSHIEGQLEKGVYSQNELEHFDLYLFNLAYTALGANRSHVTLAVQCYQYIKDEELRTKAEELFHKHNVKTATGTEVTVNREEAITKTGFIAIRSIGAPPKAS